MQSKRYDQVCAVLVALAAGPFALGTTSMAGQTILDLVVGDGAQQSAAKAADGLNAAPSIRIDQFLKDMQQMAAELTDRGAAEGRLALVQAGNEIALILGAARSQFAPEMERPIGSASAPLRTILVELQRWRDAKDQIAASTVALEDANGVDLGDTPLGPDYFGVRRVAGNAIAEAEGANYRIVVAGADFGHALPQQTITVGAKLGGEALPAPQLKAPDEVVFSVPASAVAGRFKPDRIVTLPLSITVNRAKTHWFWAQWWPAKSAIEQEIQVALLPDLVGDLVVNVPRSKLGWAAAAAATQSKAIAADTDFTFPALPAIPATGPQKGSQRYEDAVEATCGPVMRTTFKLHNGTEVADGDALLRDGWTTNFTIGKTPAPDWKKADAQANDMFGWTPGFAANCCAVGQRCHLTPAEIKPHLQAVTKPGDDCAHMQMAGKKSDASGALIVSIRGKAGQPSLWTVKVPVSTYKELSDAASDPIVVPVYASKPIEIDVPTPAATRIPVQFRPKNGPAQDGVLGENIPKGPHYVDAKSVDGNMMRYVYRFERDKTLTAGQ